MSWSFGRIDVFVRGNDAAIWHKYHQGTWSGWESLGGNLASAPAAASWGPGRLDVFARSTDSTLLHKYYQGGWSGFESLGNTTLSSPAAVSWSLGRIDVFIARIVLTSGSVDRTVTCALRDASRVGKHQRRLPYFPLRAPTSSSRRTSRLRLRSAWRARDRARRRTGSCSSGSPARPRTSACSTCTGRSAHA